MVEVIQADREAAIALMRLSGVRSEYESEIETGDYDDNFFVQSFAKHRLASTPDNPPIAETVHVVKPAGGGTGTGVVIPANMKPWSGGDSAPEDWDGGPVLLRGRVKPYVQPPGAEALDWGRSDVDAESDILAYTPNPDGGEVPFALFRWNENWGVWEQVVSEAASDEGVVAAYRTPISTNPASDRGEVEPLVNAAGALQAGSIFTRESISAARRETERLSQELDITNADHIALWLESNLGDASLGWLAVRIVEAHEEALSASTSPKDARDVD